MLTTPSVATSKYILALLRRQRNETDIARQLFREREQIYITVYGPDHSETVDEARKLVVVCSDTAQITKISQTTKENAFSTFFVCVPGLPTRTYTHTRTHTRTHTHTQ